MRCIKIFRLKIISYIVKEHLVQRPENSAFISYKKEKRCFLISDAYHGFGLKTEGGDHLRNGGAMRDRTADLLDANQALSQLSYSPL